MTQAWERWPGESDAAFSAFVIYRDLGAQRSLDAASTQYHRRNHRAAEGPQEGRRKNAKCSGQVRIWADRWDWRARAAAWDAEQDRQARQAMLQEIVDMRKRHAQEAMMLQKAAMQRLQALDPQTLSQSQLLVYFIEATKLERLSRGEPETIGEQRVTGRDGGPIVYHDAALDAATVEELRQLHDLRERLEQRVAESGRTKAAPGREEPF
jgi:hypothetical protein